MVIIKTGKVVLDTYKDAQPSDQLPPDYLQNQRDLQRLALFLLLRQAAFTVFKRYHYSLHEVLDEAGVQKFAQHIAYRLMKKLYAELKKTPHQLPEVDTLVDYLLSSIRQSWLTSTEEVTLKRQPSTSPLQMATQSRKVPLKQFCALQPWLSYDGINIRIVGVESSSFKDRLRATATRRTLGFITVPTSMETSSAPLAIDRDQLKELNIPAADQPSLDQCLFPHKVTRQEVEDYKTAYQTGQKISLNAYLSQKYSRPTQACCHDGELRGMVFVGDYSYVNFYIADLSNGDGSEGDFNHANLTRATMHQFKTSKRTNFQYIYGEGSCWTGDDQDKLVLHADISHGRLSGSTWRKCSISTTANQIGSEWSYAVLEDVNIEDGFEKRLNEEHQARMLQDQRIEALEKSLKQVKNSQNIQQAKTIGEIGVLQSEIAALQADSTWVSHYASRLNDLDHEITMVKRITTANAMKVHNVASQLDQFQEEQKERDSEQDEKIDDLAATQNVLVGLQQYCATELYTDEYRTKKATYIPLYVKPHTEEETAPQLLTDYLYNAVNSGKKYIFVSGESGYGQTFSITCFGEAINAMHVNEDSWVFIDLDVSRVTDRSGNILSAALETVFTKTQKTACKQHKCIIRLDKLDASNISVDKLIRDCDAFAQDWEKPVAFIFSVRPNYMQHASLQLDRLISKAPDDYLECSILPLTTLQIQAFLNFFPRKKVSNILRNYQDNDVIDVHPLLNSPLMLVIMTGALLNYQRDPAKQTTMQRIDFYEASWRALFDRIQYKLPQRYQTYEAFMRAMHDFAENMYIHKTNAITFGFERNDPTMKKQPLHELLETQMGALSPISISRKPDNQYEAKFLHSSLENYLIAVSLLEKLFAPNYTNDDTLALWNQHFLSRDPEIVKCLIELLQRYPEKDPSHHETVKIIRQNSFEILPLKTKKSKKHGAFESINPRNKQEIQRRLLSLVRMTHESNEDRAYYQEVSSNAFTVLCQWGRNLRGEDFSKLLLPYSEGTNGLLPETKFIDTNLTGTRLYHALLLSAIFTRSVVFKTSFLNTTRFIETCQAPSTFIIYPSLTDIIIVYAAEVSPKDHRVFIIRITNDIIEELQQWPVHSQAIHCMAITNYRGKTRMLSSGLGGTPRVFDWEDNTPPKEINKLCGFFSKPITHCVAWGENGKYAATGSEDGCVRIWTVDTKDKIYKSDPHAHPIRVLLWDPALHVLIAATDNNELSIWSYPESDTTRGYEKIILTSPHQNQIKSVYSLVLSPNKDRLAIGTDNGEILILSMTDKTVSYGLSGHKAAVTSMIWDNDLISGSLDHTIRVHRPENVIIFRHEAPVKKIAYVPHCGQIIATTKGVDNTRFYFWNPQQPIHQPGPTDKPGLISSIATHPDTQEPLIALGDVNGKVRFYPLADTEQPGAPLIPSTLDHGSDLVLHIAWSSTGSHLATLGRNQTVFIKNISTNVPAAQIQNAGDVPFTHLTWLTNYGTRNILALGKNNGSVVFYSDINDFSNPVHLARIEDAAAIQWLTTRPSPPQLAIAAGNNITLCTPIKNTDSNTIDIKATDLSKHPQHPDDAPQMLAWSPNETHLVSSDMRLKITIWSIFENTLTIMAQHQTSDISCLLWTDDWLLVGNTKELLYWNTNSDEAMQATPQQASIRARRLAATQDHIVLSGATGMLFFNKEELRGNTRSFKYKRVIAGTYLEGATFEDAKGLSGPAALYLSKNGAHVSSIPLVSTSTPLHAKPLPPPSDYADIVKLFPPQYVEGSLRHVLSGDVVDGSTPSPTTPNRGK